MDLLICLAVLTGSVMLSAYLLPGVYVKDAKSAFIVAIVLALLDSTIGKVMDVLLFLTMMTFVVNIIVILISSRLTPNFKVDSVWWALAMSIILTVVSYLMKQVFGIPVGIF